MHKSPNRDNKRHKQSRNCLHCDNGDWPTCRASECCCKERKRAAEKERFKKELQEELQELWEEEYEVPE